MTATLTMCSERLDRAVALDLELAAETRSLDVRAHLDRVELVAIRRVHVVRALGQREDARAAASDLATEVVQTGMVVAELEETRAGGHFEGLVGFHERELGHRLFSSCSDTCGRETLSARANCARRGLTRAFARPPMEGPHVKSPPA